MEKIYSDCTNDELKNIRLNISTGANRDTPHHLETKYFTIA